MARFITIFVFLIIPLHCKAQQVSVGLEIFPPFLNEDGTGLTVDMLREIELLSDLKFDVRVMTYGRAKSELKNGRLDIAGHTPKNLETQSFYQYAQELNWQIDTRSDLFTFDPKHFNINAVGRKRIGTPIGNAAFFAEQLGIDESRFIEVSTLPQLVDMLLKRRIDVLLFERVSVMTNLKEKQVKGVLYKSIGVIPASIAVARSEKGDKLRQKLEYYIAKLDREKIFSGYLNLLALPESGIVPIE
ncbi:substrate-binding periplasmic protein [Thalassotalea fusca]